MGVKERYEQRQKEGKTTSYSGVAQRYMEKELDDVASSITSRVNTWLTNHNNYVTNYQNRYSGRKYTYDDSYVKDSASWLDTVTKQKSNFDAEADSILSYMDQYKDYLDADWMKSVRDTITGARSTQGQILNAASKDNEWWNSFNDEELVKQYGSAEEAYKYFQRSDGYSKKYNGMTYDDIQNAFATLGDGEEKEWLEYNQYNLYKNDSSYNSIASSGYKSFEAQKLAKQAEEDAKPWWQKAIESFATTPADTSLPNAGLINAQVAYANDTSYHEPNEKWNEEQKNHFGYLWATDRDKAYAYAENLNNQINSGEKYAQMQEIQNWATQNFGTGAASTIGAIATAPFGLADYLDDLVEYSARGTITQKGFVTPFEYSQAVTSGIANELNGVDEYGNAQSVLPESIPIIGGKGWGDVYSLGVSAANSLVSAYTLGGTGTLVNFIGQGGASGVDDALSRGATPEQALLYGTIVGAAEGITEMLPADELLKVGSSATLKNYLKTALKQGIGEFAEEGVSAIIGNVADNIIMADKSNFNNMVRQLMADDPNLTEEEAKKKAWGKFVGDVVYDAMGGFVTGFGNAVTVGGAKTVIDAAPFRDVNKTAVAQYGNQSAELVQEGLANAEGTESNYLAQQYKNKTDKGKTLSGFELRNLITANDMQKIQSAAEKKLTDLGETGDVKRLAELATKYATGQELSRAEKKFLARSAYGSRVSKTLLPKNIMSGQYDTGYAEEIDTRMVNRQAYNKKAMLQRLREHIEKQLAEDPATYKSLEERAGKEAKFSVSKTGTATISKSGTEIDLSKPEIVDFVRDKETGKVTDMILNVDGKEVKASEIDFADADQSYLYSVVKNIENITPGDAQAIVRDYNPSSGLSVGEYLNGVDEAYTYGYNGYSEADMQAGNFAPKLTSEQARGVYLLGQNAKNASKTAKADTIKLMRTAVMAEAEKAAADGKEAPKAKEMTITYNHGKGKVVDFDKAGLKLTNKQKAAPAIAKIMHEMGLGTNFELFASYVNKKGVRVFLDENGVEQKAYSGVYRKADGTIRIDINAYNGRGLTLNAMAHELTHFIQQWSTEKYEALAEFLVKTYEKTDMTMHERVLREQARLKRTRGEEVSYNAAYDEVVANAMSKMLDDGKVMDRLNELMAVDMDLAQKLWQGLKKLLNKFFRAYDKESALFHDAADLMELKAEFEQMQKMWAEAFVEASENFQAALTVSEIQTLAEVGTDTNEQHSEHDIDKEADSAYDGGKRKIGQEGKANVTREEVSHRVDAESSRRVGKENSGRESSNRESCERRIKEILRQKTFKRNEKSAPGRGRVELRETRETFENRSRRDGLMYVEVGSVAIACKVAPVTSWNENAKAAAEKLAQYGFDVVVFTGEMLHNRNGVTQPSVDGSTARHAGSLTIFISADLDIDGMEAAYHEAFHAAKFGMFAKYHEKITNIIASYVDVESEAFDQFVSEIADLYAYTESNISAGKFAAEIIEEFYAWYVGKVYDTQSGDMQVYMAQFSDVESIKQQIDGVYAQMEANADKALPGLLEGDMENDDIRYSSHETDADNDTNVHPYSYKALISKPDMVVTTVDGNVPKNRADVVYQAKQNAAKVGKFDPKTGSVSVHVDDVGVDVLLGTDGLKHGLRRTRNAQNDANYIVTLKAGEIIKNSIKINETNSKKQNATGAYVLIGAARNTNGDLYIVRSVVNQFKNELASMDVLYAINAKKELAALNAPRSTAEPLSETSSTISIAELLDLVNQYFPDVLPEDVLKHYGYEARPEGDLGEEMLYSGHETDNISNRDLLANAFETITKDSIEYKMIQKYKSHIKDLNALEKELGKLNAQIREILFTKGKYNAKKLAEIESKANAIASEINRQDRELLSLEASEPLRKVIERERKKEAQKTKAHVKEIQENKKARAEQTELRHKIRKAVRDLDKILNRGNKKQNVKEDLQPVVTKALQAADILFTDNYGNLDMLRNGIGTDMSDAEEKLVAACAKMLKDIDKMPTDGYESWQARQEAEKKLSNKMAGLKEVFARERKRLNNATVSSILGELANAYAAMRDSEQSYVQGAYSEPVYNFLVSLQSEVGGTIVKDMTKAQLESVYAAYKMVLESVRNANKMFNEELKQSREQLANSVIEEVLKAGGVHLLGTKMGDKISQFDWNNMKPIWLGDRIGSETFGKLMNGLFKGQYNFAVDIDEVKRFKLKMDKKYHPRNWDAKKLYEFESSTGKKFSLDLQQIMSLYAFSKREQAYSHLQNGGFVFEENSTVVVDGKLGIKKTYIHKGATSYKVNEATLNDIISSLTEEQKAYVDDMQKYLSETMGAKGNEVSMRLYGIKMFNEQFYFPIRSSGAYMERAKEAEMKKQQGQINLVNSGFTHAVKPQAKNPIVLSGFMDVWAEHCNEMSMYHSMVLPMEDFRKVYNYTTVHDENMESASVFQTIQDAYGKAATSYIDQLYKELNAGATVDPRETLFKTGISNFKKAAVMLSASVVVQQFSAIGRAYYVIDPKYFIGTRVNSDTGLSVVEEMKKYAPVAIIKEMGGFDTGTKGNAKSYIMAEQYGRGERIKGLVKDEQYRSDFMGYLPAKADEKTWCAIWEAVKRETKAKNPKMDVKSVEFLKLAGERFSEVIEKTQVYDSVLARSANMRSKGGLMQMATAFMAEPTTTINLLENAIRGKNPKDIARAFGAVAVSIVLNNALASIVYAMRDDDEDETFIEKYFQSLTSGMIDDINPMSYYPFLKDVYSLFQGYDVERTDMSVIADIRDAMKKVVGLLGKDTSNMDDDELAAHNKQINEVFLSLLDAGCSAFGVPVKNVRRDVNGLINAFSTVGEDLSGERKTTWFSFWDKVGSAVKDTIPIYAWTKDEAKTDKLYDAVIAGDKAYLDRLKSGYKTEDAYHTAVRKALRENDSRIHDAAQARYEGRTEDYKRIFREIQGEGKFSFDDIMSAINSEESKIRNGTEPDKVSSDYTASGFVQAVITGNMSNAQAMKEDIIAAKVANGKTKEEAEKEFASAVSSGISEAYSAGLLDEAGAKNMLVEYADKDEEEAASKVNYWSFLNAHPQYKSELSEANVNDYLEFAEPANISLEVFAQYINGIKGLETQYDDWGDVEVTKREQVLEVIDSLPLAWKQKDALYLAAGYAESKIWDVPW